MLQSSFEWPLKTGFTVLLFKSSLNHETSHSSLVSTQHSTEIGNICKMNVVDQYCKIACNYPLWKLFNGKSVLLKSRETTHMSRHMGFLTM